MKNTKLTWLGHASILLDNRGKKILIDPWLDGNPSCPDNWKDVEKFSDVDLLLITHGHFDHVGESTFNICRTAKPTVCCMVELGAWLEQKGVENISSMNKGGTQNFDGIKVTMTDANHSAGMVEGDGTIVYLGEPNGFVIEFPDGDTVYVAGDTNVFGDMALIAELYEPQVAILPIGDHFTMGPREAGKAVELLGAKKIVPYHYGTFPLLTGTPDALRAQISNSGVEVLSPVAGETIDL